MNVIVPRTCTEVPAENEDQHREKEPRPLEAFRDVPAYVLLGDPGAGKTTAFEAEREALGEDACKIPARNFLAFNPQNYPEWRDKTLFIDGLDEVRAIKRDMVTPFDEIRGRLDSLGKPRFRLSCRAADWLGANDREYLEFVSPDSKVTVLRLDPLTVSDVEKLLEDRSDIPDAHTFITIAKEQGVDGLLANPLSLDMLAKAVASGRGWPESRKATFEMACRKIVDEHHPGHKETQASKGPPSSDQLLDAAGRLCAVQLISGVVGYTLHGQADEDYPAPDQCDYDSPEALRSALATKLFKGVSNDRFAPVHRHIAEFLGARHLAEVIKSGLPARRVIALIEGEDGTVVTEMRGLSAWLAAHCENSRAALIERDPIGVGLYGDIREFSIDNKRALLNALHREGVRLGSVFPNVMAFSVLTTSDMTSALKTILNDSNHNQNNQIFIRFVLEVLRSGAALPDLYEILLKIVRDDTWWPSINTSALDVFIHNCPDSQDKTNELKALLADIYAKRVSDPNDELLGTLLIQLYPQELPPSKVWGYLSGAGDRLFFGRCYRFWQTRLVGKSSDEQVAELLDDLAERLPALRSALRSHLSRYLPIRLLARGLKAHGDQIDKERLYNWLDVVESPGVEGSWDSDKKAVGEIRSWLEQRPDVQKDVFLEGLSRCSESDEFRWQASNIYNHLYGADLPPDFGLWCLKQAVAMADNQPHVAELLLEWAFGEHVDQRSNEGLSLEVLKEHTRKSETLKTYLDRLLAPPSTSPRQQEGQEQARTFTEERRQREEQWLEYVRSNEVPLRENRADPYLLHKIAEVYFESDDGSKAIEEEFRYDRDLIDAALKGLRGTVNREDVPDIKEILLDKEKDQMHYLGLPFLAGLEEVEEDPSQWDDSRIRKAVTFYYCTPLLNYRPEWYRRLLIAHPKIVAKVQEQFAICEFRSHREHIYKLWELAYDKAHAQVARYASLPLLRKFPTRCTQKQIKDLDYLFWAAIQHADRSSLQELIKKKLSRKSMNDAQRVHWLAAGIVVSPEGHSDRLSDFVQGRESRIRHLAKFFFSDDQVRSSLPELRVEVLELLIRLVGSYAGPDQWWNEEGLVTPETQASRFVNNLIQRLAASPTKDASKSLAALLADPALSRWYDVLSQAQDAQRVTWRDASYRHPTIEQVCQTLNDGTPANPGDLAALLMDRLLELADQIRRGNTDDWRQYWNEPHDQLPTPKHEEPCRDALLSDLRQRLPQGVDAQPEGQYANDKRADIRVSYGNFQVPVEIKKNMHRDLWSAPRNQLIAQYTSAPDTDGYGIYLVFWFGKDRTPPPPSGTRPANAKELQERLEATLSPDEARKISVCVIDVSRLD